MHTHTHLQTLLPPLTQTRTITQAQFLEFGDVATYAWADQLVTLSNANTLLPIVFNAAKTSPYFDIQPSSGLIHAGQQQQVRAIQSLLRVHDPSYCKSCCVPAL